jgi:hypothetical protein
VGISQNSNTTPSLSAAADLTSWLCELNEQVDGALADLAHTMQRVQSGTYARNANGQSFGLVQANFLPDATHLAIRALERAALTCFRSAIASVISFLDRLIAFQDFANEKPVVDHDITNLDDFYAYLNAAVNRRIAEVNRSLRPVTMAGADVNTNQHLNRPLSTELMVWRVTPTGRRGWLGNMPAPRERLAFEF